MLVHCLIKKHYFLTIAESDQKFFSFFVFFCFFVLQLDFYLLSHVNKYISVVFTGGAEQSEPMPHICQCWNCLIINILISSSFTLSRFDVLE